LPFSIICKDRITYEDKDMDVIKIKAMHKKSLKEITEHHVAQKIVGADCYRSDKVEKFPMWQTIEVSKVQLLATECMRLFLGTITAQNLKQSNSTNLNNAFFNDITISIKLQIR